MPIRAPVVIAIDGLSASGKGTIAQRLAQFLDFAHLDTGLLYRAVGLAVLDKGGDPENPALAEQAARNLDFTTVATLANDPRLRADTVSVAASKAGAIPSVRAALLSFQKNFVANPPNGKKGAVLDGRDIGTVIAPHAQVKIFVTADPIVRAARRFKELIERKEQITEEDVYADMKARDERDQMRAIDPTMPASDAAILDTTRLTADEAFAAALSIVHEKVNLRALGIKTTLKNHNETKATLD